MRDGPFAAMEWIDVKGLFSKKGRGDKTPFELLLATLNGWPNSGRRFL